MKRQFCSSNSFVFRGTTTNSTNSNNKNYLLDSVAFWPYVRKNYSANMGTFTMYKIFIFAAIYILGSPASFALNAEDFANKALFNEASASCANWAIQDGIPEEELQAYLDTCVPDEYGYLSDSTADESLQEDETTEE
jgi:hypothetical protein